MKRIKLAIASILIGAALLFAETFVDTPQQTPITRVV